MPQRAYRFGFYREAEQCRTLVVNANNGPENNGRRTQWLERLWSILENHWRGELLSSEEKTLGLARSMTYRGNRPGVRKIAKA